MSITVLNLDKVIKEKTYDHITEMGYSNGEQVKRMIEVNFERAKLIAEGLSKSMNSMPAEARRPFYTQLLYDIIEDNTNVAGSWVVFKTNAFDSLDAQYVNTPGHDSTGRFIVYWEKTGNKINHSCCNYYENPGYGDYYLVPMRTQKPMVMDPYTYILDEGEVTMVCLVAPVIYKGEPIGVTGTDMILDQMVTLVEKIKPFETGYGFLVASNGTYAAHPDTSLFGKNVGEEGIYKYPKDLLSILDTDSSKIIEYDNKGEERAVIMIPIKFSGYDKAWAFGIDVPIGKIVAGNGKVYTKLIVINGASLLLIIAILIIVSNSITKPVRELSDIAQQLSDGKIDAEIKYSGSSEIGVLAESFRKMQGSIRTLIDEIHGISNIRTTGDLAYRCNPDKFKGKYAEIIAEVNNAVECVVTPLVISSEYISKFANGDIPERIELPAKGDIEKIYGNINSTIDTIEELHSTTHKLISHTVNGNFAERGDVSNFVGNWNELVAGINRIVDAVVVPLNETQTKLLDYQNHLQELIDLQTGELKRANIELVVSNQKIREQNEELQTTLTQLKEAQTKLVHSEKMASLGIMTAGVAHEINNPLNYISSSIYILKMLFTDYPAEKPANLDELLNAMTTGVDRISTVVSGLGRFTAKAEEGLEQVNIENIIDNCLSILKPDLLKAIEIERKYDIDESTIPGNPMELHQLFFNIILNAAQSIENEGKISIKNYQYRGYFFSEIRDNGCGIKKEDLPKIQDPFFTTKAPDEGKGLGLSIAANIIKEHRGTLEFSSELHHGTKVVIKLPLEA
jgi:signal transduction histidine kinase/HAMP domain-containing protein